MNDNLKVLEAKKKKLDREFDRLYEIENQKQNPENNPDIGINPTDEMMEIWDEVERIEKEIERIEKENSKKEIEKYIETHTDETGHIKINPNDIMTIVPRNKTQIPIPGEKKKSKIACKILRNLHR